MRRINENTSADEVWSAYGSFGPVLGGIRGVDTEYLKGFLTGGAIGVSCSLTAMSDVLFNALREHIADFKKKRDFWRSSVCHILADTKSMPVLQYCDMEKEKIEVFAFSDVVHQNNTRVYPIVDLSAEYRVCGESKVSGSEIDRNGIDIPICSKYTMRKITLEKI